MSERIEKSDRLVGSNEEEQNNLLHQDDQLKEIAILSSHAGNEQQLFRIN